MGELQDGQIYRWRFREGLDRSYWCMSGIAVVHGGKLFDTYWSDHSKLVSVDDVELRLIGDRSWPQIKAYHVPLYDSADVADTRHANSMSAAIYLRPGAKRSPAAITAALDHAEEKANSDLRQAQWRLERLQEQRALLDAGRLDEVSL